MATNTPKINVEYNRQGRYRGLRLIEIPFPCETQGWRAFTDTPVLVQQRI